MVKRPRKKRRTVHEIIDDNLDRLTKAWISRIRALVGARVEALISKKELTEQTNELALSLAQAFRAEQFEDISAPEFEATVSLLRKMSASRAEQNFTPSETAVFVFAFKNALLVLLQEEFGDAPDLLNVEIIKMNKLIDDLGLVTFETHLATREEIIVQQSRSLLELSTPAIKLWDQITLMPLVGVVDTVRAQQMIETLLEAIQEQESIVAVVDVTGVPAFDTRIAQQLAKMVSAANLLGAEVIITGISPEASLTMTKLGPEIAKLNTRGSLRSGLREAFQLIGKSVTDIKQGA